MRHEKFTSSEIWKLTKKNKAGNGFGAPAITYIKQRVKQARWGKSFVSSGSVATKWGLHFEEYAAARFAEESGLHIISYSDPKKDFKCSPLPHHGGTPDFTTFDEEIVGSIKCPQEEAFIDLWDIIKAKDLAKFKKDEEAYYWQLISDKIVTGAKYCAFVIYMPYEDDAADLLSDSDLYWMTDYASIKPASEFTDVAYWIFEPPAEDVEFLTECIIKAGEYLNAHLIASSIPEGIMVEPDYSLLKKI